MKQLTNIVEEMMAEKNKLGRQAFNHMINEGDPIADKNADERYESDNNNHQSYEIYSIEWEDERSLPEMSDVDQAHIEEYSKNGKYPFIRIYDNHGNQKKIYLGA